ncbi:MAG: TonB-dependent receptor, partial [Pseudomonadota bacterium]
PVKNIARIEVMRGPGSALFGADAFAGTINIITKTAQDIDGIQTGVRAGSFDTKDAWLLHGGKWAGFDTAFSLELHSTDGHKEVIDADALSIAKSPFNASASLAPGPVSNRRDTLDTRLDLSRGDWRLRLGYQGRYNVGNGAGVSQVLDPQGRGDSDRYNADLTYHNPIFTKDWDVTAQLSYFSTTQITKLTLYPPGARAGFPDGVLANPDVYERHWRFSLSGLYTGIQNHRINLGAGVNYSDLYKTRETKNFGPPGLTPLGSVVDVTDTAPFLRPHKRDVYYALVQDEWAFAPDWALTAGARWDHYSDFGDTINPRLALVWQTRFDLTTKLLYGRAFRAPSFAELYNINNPVQLGNPSLTPEVINTTELVFDYRPLSDLRSKLSLFRYKMNDIIRFTPDPGATTSTARNTGSQTGYGFELEGDWKASSSLRLRGNYSFQLSEDNSTGTDAGNAPHHHVFAGADWKFMPNWIVGGQLNWVGARKRASGDTRPAINNYMTIDTILRYKEKGSPWAAAFSVHNLLDADAREPSPAPGSIPNDLPLPGRNFLMEVSYDF